MAAPLGVGLDLAERTAFARFDDASIRRAASRWLRPHERAWCATQPSFREAMVVALSCKEAVYKARGSSGAFHEVSLTMHQRGESGWAVVDGIQEGKVVAWWEVSHGSVLALAVAAPAGDGWRLLERILRGLSQGPTREWVNSDASVRHLMRPPAGQPRTQHAMP